MILSRDLVLRRRALRFSVAGLLALFAVATLLVQPTFPAPATHRGASEQADGLFAQVHASVAPPAILTLSSVLGGTSHAVAHAAPHVFIAVGPRVVVLDATDLAAPVELGATDMFPGNVIALAVDGDEVYAGVEFSGGAAYLLCVINVSNPLWPSVKGCTALAGHPARIVAEEGVAYVAAQPVGMDIIDVSNPDLPARITTFATDAPAYDLDIADGRAYIAVEHVVYLIGGVPNTLGGVVMVDISNPAVPVDAGVFNRDIPDGRQIVERLRVRGTRGYAIGNDTVSVYDITDPNDALLLGRTIVARAADSELALGDDELWVIHPLPNVGATRVDFSDPIEPRVTNTIDTPTVSMAWSGVAVDDSLVAATRLGGYDLLDLSDTSVPMISTPFEAIGSVSGVVLRGDYLIAAARQRGLVVIDIADPSAPRTLADVAEADRDAIAVASDADHAYLLSPSTSILAPRLDVYDLTDPAVPSLVTTLEPAANALELAVHAGRLFVVGDDFEVFDLTDPAAPARLDGIPLAESASEVALLGDHAYLGGPSEWIVPVDILDPARPVELARVVAQGGVAGLAVGAGKLFAALGTRGLATYTLADPGAPARGVEAADIVGSRDVAFGGGRPWVLKARQVVAPDPDALADKLRRSSIDLPIDVAVIEVTDELENLIVAAGEGIALIQSVPGEEPTPTYTPTASLTPTIGPTPIDPTATSTPDGTATTALPPTEVAPTDTPTPEGSTPGTPTLTPTPEATGVDIIHRIHLPWVSR